MNRIRIQEPLTTGQRVIDGLISIGRGQRVGLFAGSGVGKSTLLGEIAKGANADVNVIVRVAERGREVRPFIEDCSGDERRRQSVVIVATSDQTPPMRIKSVLTAVSICRKLS
jgi:flagellum-specific ATP synthase